eukprot:769980_1
MVGHRIDSQTGEIYHHSNQLFDHFFLSTNVNVLKQAMHSTAGCETSHYINSTKSCITAYLACMPSAQRFVYGGTQNTAYLQDGEQDALFPDAGEVGRDIAKAT